MPAQHRCHPPDFTVRTVLRFTANDILHKKYK